jgi:membrane protease YdiL (CAAX protease family)
VSAQIEGVSARVDGMDARVDPRPARTAFAVVVVGVAVLALRPFANATPDARIALLAASYLTIGLASIAVPLERDRARVAPALALLVGLGAVAGSAIAAGASVPLPWSAAALPLSLLAALAEEALFRRVAYARLERFGTVVAVAGSALLFGLVHVPAYGVAALPVDVGAGLLFGWQRWASGTWTVPAATHAFANAVVVLG